MSQLPAIIAHGALTTPADTYIVHAIVAALGDRPAAATSNFSLPTSATRTRAAPMRGRAAGFSAGAKIAA